MLQARETMKRLAFAALAATSACVALPSEVAVLASPDEVLWTGRYVTSEGDVGWRLEPEWTGQDVCETMEMVEGGSEKGDIQIECRHPLTGEPLDPGDRILSLDSA